MATLPLSVRKLWLMQAPVLLESIASRNRIECWGSSGKSEKRSKFRLGRNPPLSAPRTQSPASLSCRSFPTRWKPSNFREARSNALRKELRRRASSFSEDAVDAMPPTFMHSRAALQPHPNWLSVRLASLLSNQAVWICECDEIQAFEGTRANFEA